MNKLSFVKRSLAAPFLTRPLPQTGTPTVLVLALLLVASHISASANAEPLVRMKTVVGDFFIDLAPDTAPATVANFRNYVNSGAFDDVFIHRSVPGFIIQGGGFFWPTNGSVSNVPADPPVVNEFNLSNLRGTVAMAKLEGNPNSATSEWFVNLENNASNLDNQNGGFTVFGTVNPEGMAVVDAIAALPIVNAGGAFSSLPVLEVTATTTRDQVVLISSAEEFSTISAPAAAVLPASRAVGVGTAATGFATIVNSANSAAASCSISPATSIPAEFTYRQTNPNTNVAFGPNNPLLDIPASGAVSFAFSLRPTAPVPTTAVAFDFACGNASASAALTPGVNTFELSASTTPGADMVALAATGGGNLGINDIPNSTGSGAFAVATVNVGAEEAITVSADTGNTSLPLGLFVCPTNAMTGACTADPAVTTSANFAPNETATFAVFAQLINSSDSVAFDPAANRAFVRFRNSAGDLRGSTSVALRTVP